MQKKTVQEKTAQESRDQKNNVQAERMQMNHAETNNGQRNHAQIKHAQTEQGENPDKTDALAWEAVSTEHIVQDQWIDFRKVKYRFPDGSEFEPFYQYSRRSYVVIAALDEDGNYICVRQFRHGIGKVTVEFPAGGIEREDGAEYGNALDTSAREDALEAAKRELQEETGYGSEEWQHLITIPSNATIADNYAFVFLAKNCRKISGQNLDDTEFLEPEIYSREEIDALIHDGSFAQAIHVMALLLAENEMH